MGEEGVFIPESEISRQHVEKHETSENFNFDREAIKIEQDFALEFLESEEFHQRFVESREKHDKPDNYNKRETAMSLAEIQVDYINALRKIAGPNGENFTNDQDLLLWDARVKRALFDYDNPDSMATRAITKIGFTGTEAQFVGATNVLTFMDLWQELYPEKADVKMIVADPELDVKGSVDIVVQSEDTLLMVQLKASKGNDINIYPMENETSPRGEKVSDASAQKMLKAAEVWRRQTGMRVQAVAAEIPGARADSIRNVFGKPLRNREDLVAKLKTKVDDAGILGLQKEPANAVAAA